MGGGMMEDRWQTMVVEEDGRQYYAERQYFNKSIYFYCMICTYP